MNNKQHQNLDTKGNQPFGSFYNQIWVRQTIFTLSLTLLLGLVISITTILLDLIDEQAAARHNAQDVVHTMSHQAAQAVFNIDPNLAKLVVNGLSEYDLFQQVRIIDDLGIAMQTAFHEPYKGLLADIANFLFDSDDLIIVPLSYPGVIGTIGRIEVRLDSYLVAQRFFQRSFRMMIGSFIRNIILSACLLILFYYTLTKPVTQLTKQISTIEPNNPNTYLSVTGIHSKSELGYMTSLLNALLYRLKKVQVQHALAEQKLITHQEELEDTVMQRTKELIAANEKLQKLVTTDPLTGAHNRRSFWELTKKELSRAKRYSRTIAILICDLDHFKSVNDRFGHIVGDYVLQEFVSGVTSMVRENDLVGRYGGEEFILLLSEIEPQNAMELGQRICQKFNQKEFEIKGKIYHFSVSIGLAIASKTSTYEFTELVDNADKALYQVKNSGRNNIMLAKPS